MPVRIGVDVGGTFTKAVACDARTGRVLLRSIVPTTHASPVGVAEGVAQAVEEVAAAAHGSSAGPIILVAHSTTQAVNALLEGDAPTVGVLGIGRRPDLRRAQNRTHVGEVGLAPGRRLRTVHEFIDAGDGVSRRALETAVGSLEAAGATALCVSEAFGVDDASVERLALEVAADLGVPACGGHELSGLYGLEMRTVTGALNAAILPAAVATASVVEDAVRRAPGGAPLLVMRGDGGASEVSMMRRHPLLTAFSGPAASVAGALRHLQLSDGVVVEVGGTSTNVSTVRGGRPVLAYVRVLEHVTCVRSLDVRVAGVAGGSLLRVGRRLGRTRLEDVGPRSAHIAGLGYCCFTAPEELVGARARLIAPRSGDAPEYAVIETEHGRRLALTLTCAANALGEVALGSYARGNADAARLGFEALGRLLGTDWRKLACDALKIAVAKVGAIVSEAAREAGLDRPRVVGLGGGAGALVPALARSLGLDQAISRDAEVISSIGDALSLVRVELEQTLAKPDHDAVAELHRRAEEAAIAAGAAPSSLAVESHALPERSALRVVASGSVALGSAPASGPAVADDASRRLAAEETLRDEVELVARTDFYSIFSAGGDKKRRYAVIDGKGSVAVSGEGAVVAGSGAEVARSIAEALPRMARHYGPLAVAPAVRLLRGARLVDLSLLSSPEKATEAVVAECAKANGDVVIALLSRA
ncbi:MAG: hydantoinase/oxoprolinase family protein [Actinomycetota bacterium]